MSEVAAKKKLVYNVDELAAALGICRPVAYDLMHREDFPSIQISPRRIIVPVDALTEWLTAQTRKKKATHCAATQ